MKVDALSEQISQLHSKTRNTSCCSSAFEAVCVLSNWAHLCIATIYLKLPISKSFKTKNKKLKLTFTKFWYTYMSCLPLKICHVRHCKQGSCSTLHYKNTYLLPGDDFIFTAGLSFKLMADWISINDLFELNFFANWYQHFYAKIKMFI